MPRYAPMALFRAPLRERSWAADPKYRSWNQMAGTGSSNSLSHNCRFVSRN